MLWVPDIEISQDACRKVLDGVPNVEGELVKAWKCLQRLSHDGRRRAIAALAGRRTQKLSAEANIHGQASRVVIELSSKSGQSGAAFAN